MLKKLTMGLEDLGNSVNSNENVKNIDHVFFGVKVDIRDDTPIVTEYLGKYFYTLYQANSNSKDTFDAWISGSRGRVPPHTSIVIQDGFFRQSLNYLYIDSSTRKGTLKDPTVVFNIKDRAAVIKVAGISLFEYEQSTVTYEYQDGKDAQGNKLIRTVVVMGLMSIDYIYGTETIDINLSDSDSETTKLMIPIHRGVVQSLRLPDRNKLFHSAMYMTIQTYDKRKQKWYETSAFRWITIIIAVVLTILSAGSAAPLLAAALGVGLVAATIIFIGLQLLLGVALKFVAEAVIEIFGVEIGKWLAVVLVAVTVYMGGDASTLGSTMALFSTAMVEATVEALEQIISDIADAIEILAAETEAFSEKISKIMEEILGDRLIVDIPAILKESRRVVPIYLAQESAEQYYARIEGSRNLPEIMLGLPSTYNTKSLVPPTLDEVLEQFKSRRG